MDSIITFDRLLEAAGFIIGIIYLYYEYHASAKLWIASVIMPAISLWVYFRAGLYADFGINIYYLLMSIYGYIVWTTRRTPRTSDPAPATRPITHMPWRYAAAAALVLAAVYAAIAFMLVRFTDSNVPYYDALNTSLSIVGTWMLARKYIEQWLVWIAVDIISTGLDIYKGIYFYAVLYAIYTVVAVAGYMKWRRLMAAQR